MSKKIHTQAINGTQILNLHPNTEDIWLWENYIPAKGISGLTGASDCGKSTLLRQLALAITQGSESFLGSPIYPKNKTVLYVSSEDDAVGTNLSLSKQAKGLGIDRIDNLLFLFETENLIEDIKNIQKENPLDLVIIDTWSDNFHSNPNSFADVRADLKKYKELDCSVLLLHHNVKNSEKSAPDKNKMNGSQGMEAKLRSLLELRIGSNSEERLLTLLKGNYVPHEMKQKSRVLNLDPEYLLFGVCDDNREFGVSMSKTNVKYEKEFWIPILSEYQKKGFSIQRAVLDMKFTHPDKDVPSATWFKENNPLGRSVA